MFRTLLAVTGIAALSLFQIAFLPHLPVPFSDLRLPVVALSYATFRDRPASAALWALVSGTIFDLRGLFPFGTHLLLFFAAAALLRKLFVRFLANASLLSAFLLTACAFAIFSAGLLFADGVRVLSGSEPHLISVDPRVYASLIRMAFVNGLAGALVVWSSAAVKNRLSGAFIVQAASGAKRRA
jgi:cell shape-determining protein MreD